jgi:hypothetical protein
MVEGKRMAEMKIVLRLVSKLTEAEHAELVFASRRNRPSKPDRDEIVTLQKSARALKGKPL